MRVIELPFRVKRPILVCGADMKGAFALAEGNKAYLVDGFGALDDPDNLDKYTSAILYYEKKLGIKPKVIARDLHPAYLSSRFADEHSKALKSAILCGVQHHEAHIASAIVEHSIKRDAVGVAFDGTGYGRDGRIWGGEFFIGSPKSFRRAAHFEYLPVPGGDVAVCEPWRMAVSYLYNAFGDRFLYKDLGLTRKLGMRRLLVVKKTIDDSINSPLSSSVGRLFDAAGSIIFARRCAKTEAELPMELERIASDECGEGYKFNVRSGDGVRVIESADIMRGIEGDLRKNLNKGVISAKFHNTIAEIIVSVSTRLAEESGLRNIVLSGGVFQNRRLVGKARSLLGSSRYRLYTNSIISTNDYGIPIGQLAIAGARGSCA